MPATPPRVSIIATVYERTTYLEEALRGACLQTLGDFELIVTDDSASDAIRAICERLGDPRVRYRANAPRLGVALNIRAALAEARGTYVAILNDDDAWEPQFLERLVAPLDDDPRRVLAFCDHWLMDGSGVVDRARSEETSRRYRRDRLAAGDQHDPQSLVLRWNAVPLAMGAVFRRDALPPSVLVGEVVGAYDYWIANQLAALGRPFFYTPDRLTRYRTHAGMETGRRAPDKSDNSVFLHRTLLADARFAAHRGLLRRRLADALVESAKDRLLFDQGRAARPLLVESFRLHPSVRAFAGWLATWAPTAMRRAAGVTRSHGLAAGPR